MDRALWHVTTFAHAIGLRSTARRQSHLAGKDDVGGQALVGVVGIVRVRPVLPDIHVRKTFRLEGFAELILGRTHAGHP